MHTDNNEVKNIHKIHQKEENMIMHKNSLKPVKKIQMQYLILTQNATVSKPDSVILSRNKPVQIMALSNFIKRWRCLRITVSAENP